MKVQEVRDESWKEIIRKEAGCRIKALSDKKVKGHVLKY